MRSLNPACKSIGLLLPTFVLPLIQRPYLNLGVFALCLVLLLLSRVNLRALLWMMLPVLLMAAGTFFTGYHFRADGGMPVSGGRFLTAGGPVYNRLVLASRGLAFAGLGALLVLTTDRVALVQSMHQQLKLPAAFAYGLLAAWGVVPAMVREYRQTRAAFHARGMRVFAASPRLLKPMLVKSVRWAEALAVAMESKGFDARAPRTLYRPVPLRWRDIAFPLAGAAAPGALFRLVP